MSNKYFSGRDGRYIYCDLCGQACYVHQIVKLSPETGRGGLLVCQNDADNIDFGLVPFVIPNEQPIRVARINHTNITNGTAPLDVEGSGAIGT